MTNKYAHLKLKFLTDDYQYILLDLASDKTKLLNKTKDSKLPVGIFFSQDEFSLIAPTNLDIGVPSLKVEAGWTCFHIIGDMPFGTVQGLIAKISNKLMSESIGVCVISTFKSDWFFIRTKYKDQAIKNLTEDGWNIEEK